MAAELDLDDVAAQSPLAQRELEALRHQAADADLYGAIRSGLAGLAGVAAFRVDREGYPGDRLLGGELDALISAAIGGQAAVGDA
ncbi:MAG: hypothetical protein RL030_1746 [Pseudomonadota bacterium]|jgi:hypothetical protein